MWSNRYVERTIHDHRRRNVPHGHAGAMGSGREGNNERAFLMYDARGLVPRKQDAPGMLANRSRRFKSEIVCFVDLLIVRPLAAYVRVSAYTRTSLASCRRKKQPAKKSKRAARLRTGTRQN